jgi:hypothetical protein
MDHMSLHRLRGNLKAIAAAVGIGGMITMGAVSVAHPTSSVGTNSDKWTAEHNLTLAPEIRAQPSFEPQVIVDRCALTTIHMRMHHNC